MIIHSSEQKKYRDRYEQYKNRIDTELKLFANKRLPKSVYEPINFVLSNGGKRIRAVLVLLASEAVGGKSSSAINAAISIEILHNFTLVHDDVMDHADLRRGKPTVHKKWDENIAILSGDEMIAQAYKILLDTKSEQLKSVINVYTDALVQVCEGQGFDKEFETRQNVSIKEYFAMISKKTGRVISASTQIGAMLGGGSLKQIEALKIFGKYLGRAFQIQDDLLDITGTTEDFGKSIGGDIREGKKTFLLLKALAKVKGSERKLLKSVIPGSSKTKSEINRIKEIYYNTGVIATAQSEIMKSTLNAQNSLKYLSPSSAKSMLVWLSDQLLERTS
jgi:geranylgeranyl diphosphate synthase, type II